MSFLKCASPDNLKLYNKQMLKCRCIGRCVFHEKFDTIVFSRTLITNMISVFNVLAIAERKFTSIRQFPLNG